jgi:transcriptional regulator NrdR family protein
LDHIAYIRFAIVYLRFDDLRSIRDEINSLLREGDGRSGAADSSKDNSSRRKE